MWRSVAKFFGWQNTDHPTEPNPVILTVTNLRSRQLPKAVVIGYLRRRFGLSQVQAVHIFEQASRPRAKETPMLKWIHRLTHSKLRGQWTPAMECVSWPEPSAECRQNT